MGTHYCGDNLDILRRYLKDETVDLVYLDPPFNSAQNSDGIDSKAWGPTSRQSRCSVIPVTHHESRITIWTIIQVKGGKTGVKDVRDLRGVLNRGSRSWLDLTRFHSRVSG